MDDFIKIFNLDKKHILNKTINKKMFYDNSNLTKAEKNIIKDYTNIIKLVALLKSDTINIPSFENEEVQYLEIALIAVEISKFGKEEDISRIINKMIQYPVILLLHSQERIDISLSQKRLDKITKENNIIEDILLVKNIKSYKNIEDYYKSLKYLDNLNLYNYYKDLYVKTYALDFSQINNNYNKISKINLEELQEIYNQLKDYNKEISSLQNKVNEEDNIGRKVDLNVKLEKIKEERKVLLKRIEGE